MGWSIGLCDKKAKCTVMSGYEHWKRENPVYSHVYEYSEQRAVVGSERGLVRCEEGGSIEHGANMDAQRSNTHAQRSNKYLQRGVQYLF